MNIKDVLKDKLTPEEIKLVPRAFDIFGDVALIEIPDEISKHKKIIAEAIVKIHPVKTVCNKLSERIGDYRLYDVEVLYGTDTKTEHREFGCRFRFDVKKAYFSQREATERQRISKMIKPNEKILVMFSGIGPSPIVYAKLQPKLKLAVGIDINPDASKYAEENVRINKVSDKVKIYCGDVREITPTLKTKFNRITMPLPKGAHEFLDVAIEAIEKGGTIHFYHWNFQTDLYSDALKLIDDNCKKLGKKYKIVDKRTILPYGPKIWKICVEFVVE